MEKLVITDHTKLFLRFLILTLGVFGSYQLSSQPQKLNYRFERINTNTGQGLGLDDITCFYQDQQGYLFIGSQEGLFIHDNAFMINLNKNPRKPNEEKFLSHPHIKALLQDDQGNYWIGHANGCDKLILDKGFNWDKRKVVRVEALDGQAVNCLVQDEETGTIWIGTKNGLFVSNDRVNVSQQSIDGAPDTFNVKEIIIEKNHIWLATDSKVLKVLKKELRVNATYGLARGRINAIEKDAAGTLWVGTSRGLLQKEQHLDTLVKHSGLPILDTAYVTSLLVDQEKTIWIGTQEKGLIIHRPGQNQNQVEHFYEVFQNDNTDDQSISSNGVNALYEDQFGIIWIGTKTGGINLWKPRNHKNIIHIRETDAGEQSNEDAQYIWSIYEEDDKTLWVGTELGLRKLDSNGRLSTLQGNQYIKGKRVRSIIEGSTSQSLYLGLQKSSLLEFFPQNPSRSQWIEGVEDIKVMFKDKSTGTLLIGTYANGLYRYDPTSTKSPSKIPAPADSRNQETIKNIRAITQDRYGNFWIGTKGGIYIVDENFKSKNALYQYDKERPDSTLSDNWVLSFFEDPGSTTDTLIMWVGTDTGLNRLSIARSDIGEAEKKGNFEYIIEEDGLPNSTIYGILPDDNDNLWVSTDKGIIKIFPGKRGDLKDSFQFQTFTREDGIQGSEFNSGAYLRKRDSSLVFGGTEGLNIIKANLLGITQRQGVNVVIPEILIWDRSSLVDVPTSPRILFSGGDGLGSALRFVHNQQEPIRIRFDNVIQVYFSNLDYHRSSKAYEYEIGMQRSPSPILRFFGASKREVKEIPSVMHFKDEYGQGLTFTGLSSGNYSLSIGLKPEVGETSRKEKSVVVDFNVGFHIGQWQAGVLLITSLGLGLFVVMLRRLNARKRNAFVAQVRVLRRQMPPHFLKNALNKIQGLMGAGQYEMADKYTAASAKVVSRSLFMIKDSLVSIDQERQFLEDFVSLTKLRDQYEGRETINFEFESRPVGSKLLIPPMLLQPLVENALKWAFPNRDLDKRSEVKVSVEQNGDRIVCTVLDNGIGIEASKMLNQGKRRIGQSVSILNIKERFRLMNSLPGIKKNPMQIEIKDLTVESDGLQTGTLVRLIMPANLEEFLSKTLINKSLSYD